MDWFEDSQKQASGNLLNVRNPAFIIFAFSKGAFDALGVFYPLPWIDTGKMALLFRDKVFAMLVQEGKISEDMAKRVSEWPHSGFNIHNDIK